MASFKLGELEIESVDPELSLQDHLIRYGWATTPLKNFPYRKYQSCFFDYLEACNSDFDRTDPSSWVRSNLPYSSSKGIFKYRFGHTDWQWEIRAHCLDSFKRVWDFNPDRTNRTDLVESDEVDVHEKSTESIIYASNLAESLVVSYDGACFLAPQPGKRKYDPWWHTDQDRDHGLELAKSGTIRGHLVPYGSIQGVVCLTPAGPDDGGLVVIQGSHKLFDKTLQQDPNIGVKFTLYQNYAFNTSRNKLNQVLMELPKVKICANAGELILFDSRTLHCNIPPRSDQFRMCTYVSMAPRTFLTEAEQLRHEEYYLNGLMTGHNTYGDWFNSLPTRPPAYTKALNLPKVIPHAQLTAQQMELI